MLYNVVTMMGSLSEKRLSIDATMLKEAVLLGEIAKMLRIPSPDNPTDGFTNLKEMEINLVMHKILFENKLSLNLNPNAWIDRSK